MNSIQINKLDLEKSLILYKDLIEGNYFSLTSEGILLTGNKNKIEIIGRNYNNSIKSFCKYNGDDFQVILHYGTLRKTISLFDKVLDINIDDDFFIISTKEQKCTLPILDHTPNEYDFLDINQAKFSIPIDKSIVSSLKSAVGFAFSGNYRPQLTRVLVELEKNKMTIVSTDGHKIFMANHIIEFEGNHQFLLHKDGLDMLDDEQCNLCCFENTFQIVGSKKSFQGKLAKGEEYPDYQKVIPLVDDYVGKIGFNRKEMICALEKLITLSKDNLNVVFEIIDEQLHLKCNDLDNGTCLEIVIQAGHFGNVFKFGHNISMLLFTLKSMNEDYIYLNLSGKGNAPVVYTAKDEKRLLMPVTLTV